ncbi:MAG: hypothetical protein HUU32_05960 [Calditrichaceae bacterium]|nr:hypothetical protein [Calditrichia bacterium]NUQ40922.1 hypothetical protein [Calditrichaceae bacterium]
MYYNFQPPGMGYYAEPPDEYGYFAEEPGYYSQAPYSYGMGDPYGYYGQPPEMVGWGSPYGYGQGVPGYNPYQPMGYFAEDEPMGYYGDYGEDDPMGYYGDYGEDYPLEEYYEPEQSMGYFAENDPYGPYGEYAPMGRYGEYPEMDGYGQYQPPVENYPGMSAYPYPDYGMSGYIRETRPRFNARCGNCGCQNPGRGLGEEPGLEGYVKPETVNPNCEKFTPQPGPRAAEPDSFRPLW